MWRFLCNLCSYLSPCYRPSSVIFWGVSPLTYHRLKSLSSPFICSNSGHSLSDKTPRHYLLFWLFNKAPLSGLDMARAERRQMIQRLLTNMLPALLGPCLALLWCWHLIGFFWRLTIIFLQASCSTSRSQWVKAKARWFWDGGGKKTRSLGNRDSDGFTQEIPRQDWTFLVHLGFEKVKSNRFRAGGGKSWINVSKGSP